MGTDDRIGEISLYRGRPEELSLYSYHPNIMWKNQRASIQGRFPESEARPKNFEDSEFGIGYYIIDLHPSSGGDNLYRFSFPADFQIP